MEAPRIKDLREKAGIFQRELALEMCVNLSTVWRWEAGKSRLSRASENEFLRIINDTERLHWIKTNRNQERYKGRADNFKKGKNVIPKIQNQ